MFRINRLLTQANVNFFELYSILVFTRNYKCSRYYTHTLEDFYILIDRLIQKHMLPCRVNDGKINHIHLQI